MLPLIPKRVPLTRGVLLLPLPTMIVVEFFWQIGAFLESPITDVRRRMSCCCFSSHEPTFRAQETIENVHVSATLPSEDSRR